MAYRAWTKEEMAQKVANCLWDGAYVNLGIGMPQMVSNYLPPGREVLYHCEHGLLGVGPAPAPEDADPDLRDAGANPVTLLPGAAIFPHDVSFIMIRGGHIDVAVMGAFQVSERGDLSNWMVKGQKLGSVGGAMDLAAGAANVYVLMTHTDKEGNPKIVKECDYPLTARGCVDRVFTELAVIDVTPQGLLVREMCPGLTLEELQKVTEPTLTLAAAVS